MSTVRLRRICRQCNVSSAIGVTSIPREALIPNEVRHTIFSFSMSLGLFVSLSPFLSQSCLQRERVFNSPWANVSSSEAYFGFAMPHALCSMRYESCAISG